MRKKKKKNWFMIFLMFTILLSIFLTLLFFPSFKTTYNQTKEVNVSNVTNQTTTTIPFANENISIEVPPGVVRIEKGGRIQIV